MTDNASKILETFDRLDPSEQHSVVVSLVRRAGELPSSPLTDDEVCGIAVELFSSMDDEENGNSNSEARWSLAAKVRPCLVMSIPAIDVTDRVLTTVVPHTTSIRGSHFEIAITSRFLKPGAFDTQNVITIPTIKLIRLLGQLTPDDMLKIEAGLKTWLGVTSLKLRTTKLILVLHQPFRDANRALFVVGNFKNCTELTGIDFWRGVELWARGGEYIFESGCLSWMSVM
jgi:mRNA interferase MazF